MKSGPNQSDLVKMKKMFAAGAEPAGIAQVLSIQLKSVMMYTKEGAAEAQEIRAKQAIANKKIKRDQAIAQAKAAAEEEMAAEEEKEMLAKVKEDEKAKIRSKKSKAA